MWCASRRTSAPHREAIAFLLPKDRRRRVYFLAFMCVVRLDAALSSRFEGTGRNFGSRPAGLTPFMPRETPALSSGYQKTDFGRFRPDTLLAIGGRPAPRPRGLQSRSGYGCAPLLTYFHLAFKAVTLRRRSAAQRTKPAPTSGGPPGGPRRQSSPIFFARAADL